MNQLDEISLPHVVQRSLFASSGRFSTRAMRRILSFGVKKPSTIPCALEQTEGGDVALELENTDSSTPDTSPASAHAMEVSSKTGTSTSRAFPAQARHCRDHLFPLRRAATKQVTHFCSSCNWISQVRHNPSKIGLIQEASFISHFRHLAPEVRGASEEQEQYCLHGVQSNLDPCLRSRGF